jgi:hypothetical protein
MLVHDLLDTRTECGNPLDGELPDHRPASRTVLRRFHAEP